MKRATILVTDRGFLVPSLVVARQLHESPAGLLTDVLIFLIDIGPELTSRLRAAFGDWIHFVPVASADLDIAPELAARFSNHVPVASLMRLAIADRIPSVYEHILYLDGDMQLLGDISPLLRVEVPEGCLAACVDNFILHEDLQGQQPPWLQRYLGGLKLVAARQYFNAGLLTGRLSSWQQIAPEALGFFRRHPELCKHHDQSALNAVCAGNWLPLSPTYNFQSLFLRFLHIGPIRPKLVHFSGGPKPWQSADCLWSPRFVKPYRQLLAEHPFLSDLLAIRPQRGSSWSRLRNLARMQLSSLLDIGGRRHRFRVYLRSSEFLAD